MITVRMTDVGRTPWTCEAIICFPHGATLSSWRLGGQRRRPDPSLRVPIPNISSSVYSAGVGGGGAGGEWMVPELALASFMVPELVLAVVAAVLAAVPELVPALELAVVPASVLAAVPEFVLCRIRSRIRLRRCAAWSA